LLFTSALALLLFFFRGCEASFLFLAGLIALPSSADSSLEVALHDDVNFMELLVELFDLDLRAELQHFSAGLVAAHYPLYEVRPPHFLSVLSIRD